LIYFIANRGDPLTNLGTWTDDEPFYQSPEGFRITALMAAQFEMFREYKRRWPRAMWGFQEAAAHGLTVEGKTQLTPAEARQLREALSLYDDRPRVRDLVGAPIPTDKDGQELRKELGLAANDTSPWEEFVKAYKGAVVIE